MNDGGRGCGRERTWPVGSKPSGNSPHGLADMAGNVWEWVADGYTSSYAELAHDGRAQFPAGAEQRVARGGSWINRARHIRVRNRGHFSPAKRSDAIGFRCAR